MTQYPNNIEIAKKLLDQQAEIKRLRAEVERLQDALQEQIKYNHLRNDREAYLLAMAQWGLTGRWGAENENTERPQASEFDLE